MCRANGWTLSQWKALSDDEQLDWLAYEYRRQDLIDTWLQGMNDALKREHGVVDTSAYVALLMEKF